MYKGFIIISICLVLLCTSCKLSGDVTETESIQEYSTYDINDSHELLGISLDKAINILGDNYIIVDAGVNKEYTGYFYEVGLTLATEENVDGIENVKEIWFHSKTQFHDIYADMLVSDFQEIYKDEEILSLNFTPPPNWMLVNQDEYTIRAILGVDGEKIDSISLFRNDDMKMVW